MTHRARAMDAGPSRRTTTAHRPDGLRRSAQLFRAFLREQRDPEAYYRVLARDSVSQVEDYVSLAGLTVLDVGGGPGHFTAAFVARGAACCLIEPELAELRSAGSPPAGAIVGDGLRLPISDGAADVCFSSNVLEHVADPAALINEMIRATKAGGLIYLSFTNWYSPWGAHEMSPWHYLGVGLAERRYIRRHNHLPKNHVGTSLFPLHIGPMLRQLRGRSDVEVMDALPRYYPRWCRPLLRLPWLREVATWNVLVVLRPLANH
jgi:SAM-dependent methyltransferase